MAKTAEIALKEKIVAFRYVAFTQGGDLTRGVIKAANEAAGGQLLGQRVIRLSAWR